MVDSIVCRNGHDSGRNSRGACRACLAAACARHEARFPGAAKKRAYAWRAKHPDRARQAGRDHYARNRDRISIAAALRVSRRRAQRPEWADTEALKFFYECRPEGCHVDHILPLRGATVSGLHTETNLQWLPARLNMIKGNRHLCPTALS